MSSNKKQISVKKIRKPVRTQTMTTPSLFPDENEIVKHRTTIPRTNPVNSPVPSYSTALYIHPNQVKLSETSVMNEIERMEETLKREKEQFRQEQQRREEEFEREQARKVQYLKKELSKFEEDYNPYEIMGLHPNTITINELKKKYKTLVLKYHPDKVGDAFKDQFQMITQAYLYLLDKLEKEKEIEQKTTKKVTMEKYEDKRRDIEEDGVENIHIDKDNFNLDTFNKIFEKYRLPTEYDDGYNNLDFDESKEENVLFGKKFNQEIFHSHFDSMKNKKSSELMEYREPTELFSSEHLGFQELGVSHRSDFGSMNSMNGLSYTDYKKAHLDENLLIDAQKVKYKTYKNINQLEAERSNVTFQASEEEKRKYQRMQQDKEEMEKRRHQQLMQQDEQIRQQYQQLNKKMIVR